MRLNINLASEPYEAAQRYLHRMTAAVAALAAVALALAGYIVYLRVNSRDVDQKSAQVRQQIAALEHEKSQTQSLLNQPANRQISDQSRFLNELFARKSLSWTRVFSEMERIVPPELHVISMKPEYTSDNQLLLHVLVATDSRDRAIELVRHMETSDHFRQPEVVSEALANNGGQGQPGGSIQFDIATLYVPETQLTGNESAANSSTSDASPATHNDNHAASAGKPEVRPAVAGAAQAAAQPRPVNYAASRVPAVAASTRHTPRMPANAAAANQIPIPSPAAMPGGYGSVPLKGGVQPRGMPQPPQPAYVAAPRQER